MDAEGKEKRSVEEAVKLATVVAQTDSIQRELKEFKDNSKEDFNELKTLISSQAKDFVGKEEFNALKDKVKSLDSFINWGLRIVIGAVLLAGMAFLLNGGK